MASPAAFREPPPKPMFSPAAVAPASVPPAQVESDAALQLMAAIGIKSRDRRPDRLAPLGGDSEGMVEKVAAWAAAWSSGRFDNYASFYAPSFVPTDGSSREAWARQRETRLASSARIKVEVGNVRLRKEAPNVLITEFVQTYRSDAYRDTTRKALQWVKVGGEWLIDREITRQRRGSSARRVKVD